MKRIKRVKRVRVLLQILVRLLLGVGWLYLLFVLGWQFGGV